MRLLWVDAEVQVQRPLAGQISVDLAIVGGGLSGVGATYAVRDSGASVALLEARTLASGASGRNAGFILRGPALPFNEAVEQIGSAAATDVWHLTDHNNRLISQLIESLDIECSYLGRGSMSLSMSDKEWIDLQQTHRALEAVGICTCLVGHDQLPRPFESMYTGGIYYPGNAEMNPGRFVRGVAESLTSKVQIYEGTPITSIQQPDGWLLRSERGAVHAKSILLATNAWTSQLLPKVLIQPIRGQVVATTALERTYVPFPMYADHGYQYWRQTPEGRLLVGGWRNLCLNVEVGAAEELNVDIHSALDRFVGQVIGSTDAVERRWAGIMGFTPDMMPMVGRVAEHDNLFIAAGYSGHGVSMAFLCGGLAAQQALGRKVDIPRVFDPQRFRESPDTAATA